MPSERMERLLAKELSGELLTQAEQRTLRQYHYRQSEAGKQKREESQQTYSQVNKQFCFSLPRDRLSDLELAIGMPVTGANIKRFLLSLLQRSS
jgi:hypothetical protein